MASRSTDSLECVICNENLLDPRPLPCGHSYCGPPRLCLTSLQSKEDGLRCAVCRKDHNLRAEEIKPLYGIRDYFQGSSELDTNDNFRLPCSVHPKKDHTFWCSNCKVMVCDDCIEEIHDNHSIRRLKKYLMGKIESELGKPFHEGIAECRKWVEKNIQATVSKLEQSKLEVLSNENRLGLALQKKELFDQYEKISGTDAPNLLSREIQFLMKILDSGLADLKLDFSRNTEAIGSASVPVCASISTQTIELTVSEVNTTKKYTIYVSSWTQTDVPSSTSTTNDFEKVLTHSSSSSSENKISTATKSTQASFESNDPSSSRHQTDQSLVPAPSERQSSSDGSVEACSCGLRHRFDPPPLSAPLQFFLLLQVIKRNPLRLGPSSEIVICPFQFKVKAELVNGNLRTDKMVRVVVDCFHVLGKTLPSSTFKYKLWLRNFEDRGRDKNKEGIWSYPQCREVSWDAIQFSELVNAQRNWIGQRSGCDVLEIGFQLFPGKFSV